MYCRLLTGPDQPIQYSIREGESNSYAELRAQEDQLNVYNVYSNFTKTFDKKHYLNVMAGYNREYSSYRTYNTRKVNLITSALPEINLATGNATASNTWNELALEGYFGRVNYIYDDKYIVEFNGRYDGSSRFPKGDRWGFFPSGSLAWVLSQEQFMSNVNEVLNLSNLKLRASYGSLGNQVLLDDNGNPIYYPSIASLSSSVINYVVEGDKPTAVKQPGVVAKNLTWETVSTVNVGFDMSLFRNKFMFSFDKYTRYTNDMLTRSKELPAVFGATEPKTNAADLKTKGWEITASYRDRFTLMNSPFDWSVKFMIADYKSWITKFDNPTRSLSDYYEGQRIGEIWGFINDGYFSSQAELDALDQSAIGTDDVGYVFLVGDLKYKDLNGDNKITKGDNTVDNPGDRVIIGNSEIRFPYSFELAGAWKGFDVRMFFQGVGKRDWYPEAASIYFWGIYAQPWTNVTKLNMDHWTPENPDAYFPRVKAYIAEDEGMELAAPQTKYLQNAAYLRFKNLTVGYTLPQSAVNKLRVSSLRFYFSAENLCTLSWLDENLDPEVITNYSGFNSGVYPMQRTYSLGMNLTF
ncbi:MAG: SusC/RagA family TonB-linked outer membrane protein [Tannerellaceae bacterium]|nr:SusC/RagA family TonB-linked outer membrane protein [Tannerellaceae bacterium]